METTRICSSCRKPLTPSAPQGLCPECLLKAGLGSGVDIGPDTQDASGRVPFAAPTVEEIARLFPGLEVLGLIGQGGMGAVYRARQRELDRVVALKILPPDISRDSTFAERFTREARALAKLNHSGIVTLYEFGRADGLFFFLMEFVDGVNLRQLLDGGRLSPREALAIVPQICDALQYAHDQGLVHRDIKPENILVDRRGRVKVADFGLAKLVGTNPLTRAADTLSPAGGAGAMALLTEAGNVLGTPQYMAPEQREHPNEVDHRADIYSLGVVFYQMLTGELPGRRIEPPSSRVRGMQVDVRLDEVVLRALEKEPERRYQHASEVKTDVETIARTPPSPSPTPDPRAQAEWRRHFHVKAGCFFFGAVCFLIAAISFFTSDDNDIAAVLSLAAVYGFSIAGYRYFQAALALEQTPGVPAPRWFGKQRPSPGIPAPRSDHIHRAVRGPAIGLLVTGILNWILLPVLLVTIRWVVPLEWRGAELHLSGQALNAFCVASLALSSFVIYAALKMWRLEAHRTAVLGSIAALLATPGNVLGLPLGIWALVTLSRSGVRAAFQPSPAERWYVPAWAAFLAIGLLGASAVQWGGRLLQGVQTADAIRSGQASEGTLNDLDQKQGIGAVGMSGGQVLPSHPGSAPRTASNMRRKFVRLVADKGALTFEGQPTSWDDVSALLVALPDRTNTVLEFAVTTDQLSVAQQNEWFHKATLLAHRHGFEYASFIGIHALGSKGTSTSSARPVPLEAQAPPGEYRVELTNGVVFEVLALSSTPRAGMAWWRPDGTLLAEGPGDRLGEFPKLCPSGKASVEFAVLIKAGGKPNPEAESTVGFDPQPLYITSAELHQANRLVSEVTVIGFRSAPENLACRIGLADGEWQRVAMWDGAGALLSNDSGGPLQLVRSSADDETCLRLHHQIAPDRFGLRLAVRLKNGESRLARVCRVDYGGDQKASSCALVRNLSGVEVIAYELYLAPLRWALIPALATKPDVPPLDSGTAGLGEPISERGSAAIETAPPLSFGPVIERKLRTGLTVVEDRVLNLDDGRVLSVPTNMNLAGLNNPRPLLNWMVKEGADLLVTDAGPDVSLHLNDGLLVQLAELANLDGLAASEVERALARPGASQTLKVTQAGSGTGAVLAFKTREGGVGLLQILGFSDEPRSTVKIRYKLLKRKANLDRPIH